MTFGYKLNAETEKSAEKKRTGERPFTSDVIDKYPAEKIRGYLHERN